MLMNVWLAFNIFGNVLQNSNDGIKTVVEVGVVVPQRLDDMIA